MSQDADAPVPTGHATSVQDFANTPALANVDNFQSSSTSSTPPTSTPQPTAAELPCDPPRVHYGLQVNTNEGDFASKALNRSDTQTTLSPATMRRRIARAPTFRDVDDFEDYELRTGWRPGAEPGVDPRKPNGGHDSMPSLEYPCQITVVDFSQSHMEQHCLENASLVRFLDQPQPKWSKCRWINVNGLSWDVISALGKHKNLHKLAIEDIMNTRNRTKADWYSNHAFIILSLQKLVHIDDSDSDSSDDDDSDGDENESNSSGGKRRLPQRLRRWWSDKVAKGDGKVSPSAQSLENGLRHDGGADIKPQRSGLSDKSEPNTLRTLQRYHGSNEVRTDFMEKFSVLAERKLAVVAEQVSVFITNDNTIISFFEFSAQQVEQPILVRLSTPDTILRQSCDASMIGQALLDAIIDLAIPLTGTYGDVIGDLELDVLTRPNITHTKKLYITIGELNKIISFVNPIISLINSLRDHKSGLLQATDLQNPSTGVVITPLTHTYLGDVLDHAVLIVETLQQQRTQADGMIDLIFNTISAYQNESLKQLTLMTIIFLPLTFITGYFGMNFEPFEVLQYDVQYFWKIAMPAAMGTCLFVMRDIIWESLTSLKHKHLVIRLRKDKRKRRRRARRKSKIS